MFDLVIKSAVSRCRVGDIESLISQWGVFDQEDLESVDFKSSKDNIRRSIATVCKNKLKNNLRSKDKGLNEEQIGDLDLLCTQLNPSKKKWSVYQLEDRLAHVDQSLISNAHKFKRKMKEQITLYFDTDTYLSVRMYKGALWMRIYIQTGQHQKFMSSNVIYLVHYPRTQYIAMTNFKVSVQEYLFQSLLNTIGYENMKNMLLTGSHVNSLLQLALNKHSQGGFSSYRLSHVQNFPLSSQPPPKKRKAHEIERDPEIVCEDEPMKRKREEQLEKTFGPHEQPTLEKLEYKVEVRFKGTEYVPAMRRYNDSPFKCRVKFEGPAVLEGLRNLGSCGIATVPMPKHLANIHSLAKNHFMLKDSTSKTRASMCDESATPVTSQKSSKRKTSSEQVDQSETVPTTHRKRRKKLSWPKK